MSDAQTPGPLFDDPTVVGVFSRGIMRIPQLDTLLGARRLIFDPSDEQARELDAVVGWGRKPNTIPPARFARRHGLRFLRLEDGFLRSVGLGVGGAPPLSIVVDDVGIYYDATAPSRLERLLAGDGDHPDPLRDRALHARARRAIDRIVSADISKYNDAPPGVPLELGPGGRSERVLVVDQTAGDMSLEYGGLVPADYSDMLDAALEEHPEAEIVVKTHPDVLAGKRQGCVPRREDPRIRWFTDHVSPYRLLAQCAHVYVGTSQLGFEALLAGAHVHCFGRPFYAGWGLTDDRSPLERRGRTRTIEEVFAAAYLLYPRYRHPAFARRAELEDVLEHLVLQRRTFEQNRGKLICVGFSPWKRAFLRDFMRCPGNEIEFARSAEAAERIMPDDARLVVWGRRDTPDLDALVQRLQHEGRVIRVEDGFLRSVGLGSDLIAPASLVFDGLGIYFDPTQTSDLEWLLSTHAFGDDELARARALIDEIVARRVSKYVVGKDDPLDLRLSANQRVVLVPGQVEDDASIQLGCVDIRTNEALIRAARKERPSAYLIYKPHPDVVSGNRQGGISDETKSLCDAVIEDRSLDQCLDVADEVHTMTSLVGFESLLRSKRVHVYGRPFYSGWGLTEDRHAVDRRGRPLTLEQLVAGALLHYARYVDPETREFTSPEVIIERLVSSRDASGTNTIKAPWVLRQARKLLTALQEIRRVR